MNNRLPIKREFGVSGNYDIEHLIWLNERVLSDNSEKLRTPEYQRPLVWSEEQKIKFIMSLVDGYPEGKTLEERIQIYNRLAYGGTPHLPL